MVPLLLVLSLASALSARVEKSFREEFARTNAKVHLHGAQASQVAKFKTSENDVVVCEDGQPGSDYMKVWLRSDNSRSLAFGDDLASSQTSVWCKGSAPPSCETSGPPPSCAQVNCPCDADTSSLDFPYMRAITKEVVSDSTCGESSQSRLLLIGLGGGALTMYLQSHCRGLSIDAVDANKHVVDAAYHLFGLDSAGSKVSVEVADGGVAVQSRASAGSQYDFIVVDCFQAQGQVPESCRSADFVSGLHSILKPGGKILQQVWKAQFKSVLGMYHSEFGIARSFAEAVDGMGVNYMIVAGGKEAVIQRHAVKEASTEDSPHVASYFKATGMPESADITQNITFAEAKMSGKWDAIRQDVKQSEAVQAQKASEDAAYDAADAQEQEEEENGEVPRWDALKKKEGNAWQDIMKAPVDMNAHVDIKDVMN
eukprot:gnl/MRDRNA2_/MRDRNA2_97025_c0_seq1.p1 gnl/MRDRNA2_/MRDRNA2_97025_c0~~gnl/MRDRNA2_/MRDRNA2_97025_c0_seq1.p1  ORF type:complete len:427 (-),score=84.96 gnl/MRDRNA2_/MRDRNA2_97025_c0_seq1:85-1365(-)